MLTSSTRWTRLRFCQASSFSVKPAGLFFGVPCTHLTGVPARSWQQYRQSSLFHRPSPKHLSQPTVNSLASATSECWYFFLNRKTTNRLTYAHVHLSHSSHQASGSFQPNFDPITGRSFTAQTAHTPRSLAR